jgi:transcription antitermination factor NusG
MGEACFNLRHEHLNPLLAEPFGMTWYSVQTGYRSESRVARDLTAKGFETYLPLLREEHQWTDRRKQVDVPAFSGYLFVRYEPSICSRIKVLETSGVLRLLGGNHNPSPIPDLEIEAVRTTLNSGLKCKRWEGLIPGSAVRVVRGPLSGVQGKLMRIKNCFRIVVAISVFSQAISAELGLNDVEAIHEVYSRALTMGEASQNQFIY